MRSSHVLWIGEEVEAERAHCHRHEVLAMHLSQHAENHLDYEAEVCDTEPGHVSIAHRCCNVLRCLVQLLLVFFLLVVILVVTFSLLS